MVKKEYFNSKKHEVLENKSMIHVFKKSIFGNLKWWKGFAKEYYSWIDDEDENGMFIVVELNSEKADKTCATKHVIPPEHECSGILPKFT